MTVSEAAAMNRSCEMEQVSMADLQARLAAIGYMLDRSNDCRSVGRIVSGKFAGQSYQCCTAYVRQADDGMSFAHYNARRDSNYRKLQEMRKNIFSVSGKFVYEL